MGFRTIRDERGFTLAFALMLCVMFSTLLIGVYLFINSNTRQSYKTIVKAQAMSVAEAGNARAISRLNIKTLPTIPKDGDEGEDDDDFFDDEDDDDDFFDDDDEDFDDDDFFDDEDDEDFDDEDDDDFFGEEFSLENTPRYINFYQKDPYYVNISSGSIVSQGSYYNLIAAQRERIALAKKENPDDESVGNELLVEDLYLPLPEVNVERIGTMQIKKGTHFKPGLKIILANKAPIQIKQPSIREEYLSVFPEELNRRIKTKIYNITPNYGEPGQIIDVNGSGENLDSTVPSFREGGIQIIDTSGEYFTAEIPENVKPGSYKLKWGSDVVDFYVVPSLLEGDPPEITNIYLPKESDGQFTKVQNSTTIKGLKLIGNNLGNPKNIPIIVPDAKGVQISIQSFSKDKIIFDLKIRKATPGSYLLTVFNENGQSNGWIFNISEKEQGEKADPDIGTYSTVITLLKVESLSNIPFGQPAAGAPDPSGRPTNANGNNNNNNANGNNNGGRPSNANGGGDEGRPEINKNFDLLKSDLETIWRVETVATVNKVSYKATSVVRRTLPRVSAALTTNSKLSFGLGDIKISGLQEATTTLEEAAGSGDTTIEVTGTDPDDLRGISSIDNDQPDQPTCDAVIENLNCGGQGDGPASQGFEPGKLVAIINANTSSEFTDYSIVESIGANTISVEDPGFNTVHYINDQVIQFTPSVITDYGISRLNAQKYLEPPSSHIKISGAESFEQTFKTRLGDIKNWTNKFSNDTDVPVDEYEDYEGFFGLNIIEGTPNFDGLNALAGEGLLIVDTTFGGIAPAGTVKLGGNSKLPSIFEGVLYIIGNLQIVGDVQISGGIIVNSPAEQSTISIGGRGSIRYSEPSVNKAIIGIPFTQQLHALKIEPYKDQDGFLEGQKSAIDKGNFKVKK